MRWGSTRRGTARESTSDAHDYGSMTSSALSTAWPELFLAAAVRARTLVATATGTCLADHGSILVARSNCARFAHKSGRGWAIQKARQFAWSLCKRTTAIRFLIHDRDSKFSRVFDCVSESEGIEFIRTTFRAPPQANAFAERWFGTIRRDCLDWLLIVSRKQLECVLNAHGPLQHPQATPRAQADATNARRAVTSRRSSRGAPLSW